MRLTPTSTYTQSINPNTQASFTPTNNKSIEKNVQAPSQRTGATVLPEHIVDLFFHFKYPHEARPSTDSRLSRQSNYHLWAQRAVEFYGPSENNNPVLADLWTQVARIIDPENHRSLSPLKILLNDERPNPRLSLSVSVELLRRVIGDDLAIQKRFNGLQRRIIPSLKGIRPERRIGELAEKRSPVSAELPRNYRRAAKRLEVFARLLDALQLEAEKTPSA
jgi:hypothetical protein